MKKVKPSGKVRAEIAKLAALPDRDIKLDDIPEIQDWSGAVPLLPPGETGHQPPRGQRCPGVAQISWRRVSVPH